MQTFLPYADFEKSLRCLDNKRLGKQRVESLQILNVLYDRRSNWDGYAVAWENHPAVRMWEGYDYALRLYYNLSIIEWRRRGFNSIKCVRLPISFCVLRYPSWLGDEQFHSSHRSNLLRKAPEYYLQFNWTEDDTLAYFWPVS